MSSSVPHPLACTRVSGHLVKMQTPILRVPGRTQESTFLTSSQVIPMLQSTDHCPIARV